jgi:hypothetical protein
VTRAITGSPGRIGSGRRGGRRGGGRFTLFRAGGSFFDYMLLMLATRFMAPWLVAFVALPTMGQLWHAAWGGIWWTWIIAPAWCAFGLFEAWVTVGGSLRRFAQMLSALNAGDSSKGFLAALAKIRISGEAAARGQIVKWRAGITFAFASLGLAAIMTCGLIHGLQTPVLLNTAGDGNPLFTWQWPVILNDWVAIPYLMLAVPLCMSWNKARASAVVGSGEDDRQAVDDIGPLAKVLSVNKPVNIIGQTKDPELGRVETKVHHPGVTTEQIQSGLGALVSEAGLPRDGHAVIKDAMSDMSMIVTMSWSTLEKPQPWLGPYNRGDSISTPVRVGIKQNGKPLETSRAPSRPPRLGASPSRNGKSIAIQGVTGAGKTEAVITEFAESISRRDAVWWWVDTTKAGATADDIRPGIDWLATSDEEALRMVTGLKGLIAYRAVALKAVGLREWEPRAWELAGIPFLIVHIEEVNSVIDVFGPDIIRRAEAVRSVGISLSCSSQRLSADNFPTGLRSQLGCGWEFGLRSGDDITFCLSNETIKAGADAEWSDTKPGQCYLEAAHVGRDEWPVPGRTSDRIDPAVLRRHLVAEVTRQDFPWPGMTPGEAKAIGKSYASRNVPDLAAWIEANAVDLSRSVEELRALAATVDEAFEEATPVRLAVREGPTEELPAAPADPPADPPAVDPLTDPDAAAEAATANDQEEVMRNEDKAASRLRTADRRRHRWQPDGVDVRDMITPGSGLRDPLPPDDLIVSPEDDIEFRRPQGAVPMDNPEDRNKAFDAVLRTLFEKKGVTDPDGYIDVDTKALGELWSEAGGFGTGNRRASLLYRIHALRDQGFATRIRERRGRTPEQWRILRKAVDPPAAVVDTEPDLGDEAAS